MHTHVFEPTDPRLGRHVVHDPRSRDYNLTSFTLPRLPAEPIRWERRGPLFDQQIGCCTACAALGLMMTDPFSTGVVYTMDDCLDFYHDETSHDGIRGVYPPDDTGSSSLAAVKTLKRRGLINSYAHAFSPVVAVAALARGPISVGTIWLDSMFEPRRGRVIVDSRSPVAGGHEYVIDGWDPSTQRVHMTNSWNTSWGVDGGAEIAYGDFTWLLKQDGDAVQPIFTSAAASGTAAGV